MRWVNILCMISMAGCGGVTIRIDPIPSKKLAGKHTVSYPRHIYRSPTPTPTVTPCTHPLQLEPTEKPTPMIKISNTAWGLSTDPMI